MSGGVLLWRAVRRTQHHLGKKAKGDQRSELHEDVSAQVLEAKACSCTLSHRQQVAIDGQEALEWERVRSTQLRCSCALRLQKGPIDCSGLGDAHVQGVREFGNELLCI
jgi:hypothetical protein